MFISSQNSEDDAVLSEPTNPLHEFSATDKISVLMGAVLNNELKPIRRMLSSKAFIWNQRGPCGRTPEQAALDLGHMEAYAMLVAVRERAEFEASLSMKQCKGPIRL